MPIVTSQTPNGEYTPILTLVGGAGNTVPVYTTNRATWQQVGNKIFVDVQFTGDGGAEGAGTGRFDCSLPFTSSSSFATDKFPVGTYTNGGINKLLFGDISASATTIKLYQHSLITTISDFQGADQDNTTRNIRLQFNYNI